MFSLEPVIAEVRLSGLMLHTRRMSDSRRIRVLMHHWKRWRKLPISFPENSDDIPLNQTVEAFAEMKSDGMCSFIWLFHSASCLRSFFMLLYVAVACFLSLPTSMLWCACITTHSSVDEHLGGVQFGASMNKACGCSHSLLLDNLNPPQTNTYNALWNRCSGLCSLLYQ